MRWSNSLFESNPQYREKAVIWRVLSLLPLHSSLSKGHVWRWWAANIPMDLGTGGTFTSDMDLVACLREYPPSNKTFYYAWEVKVSKLHSDGHCSSLKTGKTRRTISQLSAYRNFGAPQVSLLDVYVCEDGFLSQNGCLPDSMSHAIRTKIVELNKLRFGYSLLPFEHGSDCGDDIGLKALDSGQFPCGNTIDLIPSLLLPPSDGFLQLMRQLNYVAVTSENNGYGRRIVFCRNCRRLQVVDMRSEHHCPKCQDDLLLQS